MSDPDQQPLPAIPKKHHAKQRKPPNRIRQLIEAFIQAFPEQAKWRHALYPQFVRLMEERPEATFDFLFQRINRWKALRKNRTPWQLLEKPPEVVPANPNPDLHPEKEQREPVVPNEEVKRILKRYQKDREEFDQELP